MLPAVRHCVPNWRGYCCLTRVVVRYIRRMVDRVALFVDAQNVYRGARESFATARSRHVDGQIDPMKVGQLICDRGPSGAERELVDVRVYTGRPDSSRQPQAYAAHMRQCAGWERHGIRVVARALRYPRGWPAVAAQEKGVDVQLSLDFVVGAIDRRFDIGVIFSTDSDLRPAIEFVMDRFPDRPRAEVAAWQGAGAARRLSIAGPRRLWSHMLDFEDYLSVHDPTDYNRP